MISLLKKAFCLVLVAGAPTSIALAQSAFFEVRSTPYDHQMERVQRTLNAPTTSAVYAPSLDIVNGWMMSLRSMPYQYSHEWRTPYEVEMSRVGDCKGKALVLYGLMRSNGANNVRFVIGKRRMEDALTHAWLEWDTKVGTFLLDPTFNWSVTPKTQDWQNYKALYGYRAGHKYRAANSLFANRNIAARNPAAPAHGTMARTVPSTYPSNHLPVYGQPPIRSVSQSRRLSSASPSPQSQVHNFRGSVYPQRKPISNPVRYDKLARPALVQSGPVTKQRWPESELLVQH